jgi:hypothetical protein
VGGGGVQAAAAERALCGLELLVYAALSY